MPLLYVHGMHTLVYVKLNYKLTPAPPSSWRRPAELMSSQRRPAKLTARNALTRATANADGNGPAGRPGQNRGERPRSAGGPVRGGAMHMSPVGRRHEPGGAMSSAGRGSIC